MEAPEVIYEWEETFEAENSVWTAYSTDDCEVMEISLKACRQVTTIYIGSYNTPYVINFAARMQVNSLTQHTRWMRRLPPLTFSASPSAVAAIIAAPFQVILFSVFWSSSQYIYISCSRLQGSQTLETSVQNVVEGGLEIVTFEDGDACPICLESFDPSIHSARAWKLRECHGHFFHATCITAELTRTGVYHKIDR